MIFFHDSFIHILRMLQSSGPTLQVCDGKPQSGGYSKLARVSSMISVPTSIYGKVAEKLVLEPYQHAVPYWKGIYNFLGGLVDLDEEKTKTRR